jgi:hypothetical protein
MTAFHTPESVGGPLLIPDKETGGGVKADKSDIASASAPSRIGETGTSASVEIKPVRVDITEEALAALEAEHPYANLVDGKFEEALAIFDKQQKAGKLKSGYDDIEGPTIGLTNNSAGMVRLHETGALNTERFEEGRANLAETAFIKLFMDRDARKALSGELEVLTLEILKLKSFKHVQSKLRES